MLPSNFIQGDVLNFTVDPFTDSHGRFISPPDWTLAYHIRGVGNSLSVSATNFSFSIPSLSTLACVPGRAYFQIIATKTATGEKSVVQSGPLDIIASFEGTNGTFDPRSQTKKDLDQVQALIRQLMQNGGVVEYKIGTRQLKRYDLAELRSLESQLKGRLANEEMAQKIKAGEGNPNALYVRFK
ncbi:MAG: hypothetical protein ACXWM2_05110 [Parachlamydiaceae bacterium]